ncbi:MAG: ATP-binding protein [Promethearchaeota archaeon]
MPKKTSKKTAKKSVKKSSKKSVKKSSSNKGTKKNTTDEIKRTIKIMNLGQDRKDSGAISRKMRPPAEELYKLELEALKQNDTYPKPFNWQLSPKMVELFITGTDEEFKVEINGEKRKIPITTKFFGDRSLIQKSIVTLASERGLMLIGEPGTAKSWLSEHLSAAISGISTYLIQGTAGTTEDQIRYSWNYSLLIAEGPSEKALVPSPTIHAMRQGKILRFEELTRCPQEIQDGMISIMSEKVIPIPELGSEYLIYAIPGFNVIATANDRDRGVNEMSAALKRRFNFIYIPVIADKELEKKIVIKRTNDLLTQAGFKVQISEDTLDMLVTMFQELRTGKSKGGGKFTPISSVMSTSEEISLLFNASIYAKFFGKESVKPEHIAMNLKDTVIKDEKSNLNRLKDYFDIVIKSRKNKTIWNKIYNAFKAN